MKKIAFVFVGHIMGSGMGGAFLEPVDHDIQTTDPKTVETYGLKRIRLGDVVAIRDHYDYWGRGRYEGAVTIAVVVHGFSQHSGHGPGVNPILSALPGKIVTKPDPNANIAYYPGIKPCRLVSSFQFATPGSRLVAAPTTGVTAFGLSLTKLRTANC